MKTLRALLILFPVVFLAACVVPPDPKDYTDFRNADPKSVLIVPAVNKSIEVTAADYYLATISVPIAERGYYSFPVHLVKRIMEDDGLSDADMVHAADTVHLASLFGADAVLYVTIERWESKYMVFATSTEVEFTFVLKDGQTGEELWRNNQAMVYQPQSQGGGVADLIANLIISAIERAAPNYIPLARQANHLAVLTPGQGIPAGPYAEKYLKDYDNFNSAIKLKPNPAESKKPGI
jgi:hypothetical protein